MRFARRKGTMIDMFFLMIVFLVLGMVILVGIYLTDQIFPELESFFGSGETATTVLNTAKQGYRVTDSIFIFLYFMLCGTPIVFAALVKTHPAFFIVNLIVFIVFFLITPSLSNVMREFWSADEFAPYAYGGGGSYTFTIMTSIFRYLPYITMGISIILMIVMFAKDGGQEGLV